MKFLAHLIRGLARGIALFFGVFSAANIFVSRFGTGSGGEDIWWISMTGLPSFLITIISVCAAVLLVGFALKPKMGRLRTVVTLIICAVYIFFAAQNTAAYYRGLSEGLYHSTLAVAVPFSLFMLLLFIFIVVLVLAGRKHSGSIGEHFMLLLALVAAVVLFPVAQIYTFGTTDYARKADVLVVLGAASRAGEPLPALRARLDHALALYDEGLVPKIIMSGGIESSGENEATTMRAYALRRGVPASAVLIDEHGSDTDHTVTNTIPLFESLGAKTVLVDSHFYHLPRIKMAYRAKRINALTTPCAPEPSYLNFAATVREIPAFWMYWLRSGVRSVR